MRLVSCGGGHQSIAMLVLSAQRVIDWPTHLFANVGDDSENPETLVYLHDVAMPYAAEHGIELVELHRQLRGGGTRTLLDEIRTQDRSIPIPARMGAGGFGRKKCTDRFKIAVVRAEARRRGATADNPAEVAIGISTDELDRAGAGPGPDPRDPTRLVRYPLIELGLSRADCDRLIVDAGLPIPPKSSCVFCPLHDAEAWRALKRAGGTPWETAVEVDTTIRDRARRLGRGDIGLVSPTIPLEHAIDDQLALFEGTGCDSGWCMT